MSKGRRRFLEALGLGGAFLGIQYWQGRGTRGTRPRLVGTTLEGVNVPSDQGPHLVHFWASWCGVCGAMAHNIEALQPGVPVWRVATRSGTDAELRSWLETAGETTLGVINDPGGRLARAWGVGAYPTTFVVDGDGVVVDTTVGYTTELGLRARYWMAG